eukprot:scaffold29912_cov67-Cyclotella_meneghiniana.AAC.15
MGFAPSSASATSRKDTARFMSDIAETPFKPNPAIKLAANGMSLLKPVFVLEANLQAAVLGAIFKVDKEEVAAEIESLKKENNVLIYTYGLSPFSTEALSMLDKSGVEYTKIELGAEWFALGGRGSETRVALSKEIEGGSTSLPKIFIGGECIGGCAELANLVESGELNDMIKSAKKDAKKTNFFTGLFA